MSRRGKKPAKGPLIRVELQPGRYVKMHRQDAIDQGLLKPKKKPKEKAPKKGRKPARDKMRRPERDKALSATANKPDTPPDDFTVIPGVGPATAGELQQHGIRTFEQLRKADVGFLHGRAQTAIEEWLNEAV